MLGLGRAASPWHWRTELSRAEIDAVDISAEALEIAKANAVRLQLCASRVNFREGNLLEGFERPQIDLVVSNPP